MGNWFQNPATDEWEYDPTGDAASDAHEDRPAATAGQEDHSDPWVFAGADADAPGETS